LGGSSNTVAYMRYYPTADGFWIR